MKDVEDLTESAAELTRQGLSKGEIADELNVSRETASWLVERGEARAASSESDPSADAGPGASGESGSGTSGDEDRATVDSHDDIHVDWSTVGERSTRLRAVGEALADVLAAERSGVDLTVGIEKAGAPLATVVAERLETDLATYQPTKHQWEEGDLEGEGTFSRNFATVADRECYVVDDIVTSGTTMRETVAAVREQGGEPAACAVIADKRGIDEIAGVPVGSLLQVIRVGDR